MSPLQVTACQDQAMQGMSKIPDDRRCLDCSHGPPGESKHKPAESCEPSVATPQSDHPSRQDPALQGVESTSWFMSLQIATVVPLHGFLST